MHWLAILVRIHGKPMAFKKFIWDMAMFVSNDKATQIA
jgi:hypothetical protein